jgi:ribonuclease D
VTRWAKRDPAAAERLSAARAVLTELSAEVAVPVENLLYPELLRRLCWDGVDPASDDLAAKIDAYLADGKARAWQRSLVVPKLAAALARND